MKVKLSQLVVCTKLVFAICEKEGDEKGIKVVCLCLLPLQIDDIGAQRVLLASVISTLSNQPWLQLYNQPETSCLCTIGLI